MKTVGLFTSVYFNNIGNAFIDYGAEATLKNALPEEYKIVKFSQCANFAASMGTKFLLKEYIIINWIWVHFMQKFAKKTHDQAYKAIETLDIQSPSVIFKTDYLVVPGCVLTVPFISIYGGILLKKHEEGCKIIFLGASGNYYTDYEIKYVSDFLLKLKPFAIMTRDSVAYQHYKDFAKYSYNGIDNVFFVNKLDIFNVDISMGEYDVINLEEPQHKEIEKKIIEVHRKNNKKYIISNHKPFPYSKISKLVKKGVMISDYPLDYLLLYKNAKNVYSDRVHACIPTLSFGNNATLFSNTPRKALFENVGVKEIKDNEPLEVIDLEHKQNSQIEFLSQLFK